MAGVNIYDSPLENLTLLNAAAGLLIGHASTHSFMYACIFMYA